MTPDRPAFRPRGPYTLWAAWLEEFARGSGTDPSSLPPLDERLDPTTADLIVERLADAFRRRTELWQQELWRDFDNSGSGGPDRLAPFLARARTRLHRIRDSLHACPGLPQDARDALDQALTLLAGSAQQEFERWAARQPEPARMGRLVRANPISLASSAKRRVHDLPPGPVRRRPLIP